MARIRLQDVAERAGVSIKTVSNVVNGKGTITPATRERVQQALADLQYRPNVAARHLRRGASGMIAVALPELTQPYFAEVASELVRAAKARHLTVLLAQTDGLAESERAISDGLDMPLMDGLVMSPLALTAEDLRHRLDSTPIVLLGEHVGIDSPFPHVAIDNRRAARTATAHLAQIGRRRIAAIGAKRTDGPNATPAETAELRLDGYRAGLADAGLPWRDELVAAVADFHRADGASAMHRLLDLAEPPDAVFCFNDLLALGALRALRDRGLTAPDDVAVIGIDDIEEGRFSTPSLSTVAPDKRAIAETAIDLLMSLRGTAEPSPVHAVAGHRLVARESTTGPGGPP
ncbi:LacI family DNA-binding transcriptional regulator [Cellulomonas carbonis]|uniref:LacI family transcriptional regulator n=1 Tax=Cellulomonas carbonis T26 TaxID=947969 RepID=A0A0A0BUA9_9CELL|nr:LacI family DNA-binding transcriptional regulator [Cellulomonas carbonis]KGM11521.1 LacI family transcriptional regulator [Cellulomonas carbonis T26]GGC02675.1 LacI family transcriptional regulator [Cellulomonas carbonis]